MILQATSNPLLSLLVKCLKNGQEAVSSFSKWNYFCIPLGRAPSCSWVLRHLNQQSPGWEDGNQPPHQRVIRYSGDSSHSHLHLFIRYVYLLAVRKMAPHITYCSEHCQGVCSHSAFLNVVTNWHHK